MFLTMTGRMVSSEGCFNNPKKNSCSLNQYSNRTNYEKRFTPYKSHRRLSSLQKFFLEGIQKDSQISDTAICEKLDEIAQILIRDSYTRHKYDHIENKVKVINTDYRITMASYLKNFKVLVESKKKLMIHIEKSVQNFFLFSQITAKINLISSILDVGIMLASSLSKSFLSFGHYKLLLYASTFTACASITGSLFAITHVRNTADSISRMVREDKYMQLELESMFYRGNYIDDAVQKLFPYGVNLNLIQKDALGGNNDFENEQKKKQYMCFIILLSNVKKDMQLLKDEEFLTTVKIFVESPAAQIWWNRMKIRKLMEDTPNKAEEQIDKVVKSSTEVFLSRTAFNLSPIMLPLFINTWNYERTRLILRTITAIISVLDVEDDGLTALKSVRQTVKDLQIHYKKTKNVYEAIAYEYD